MTALADKSKTTALTTLRAEIGAAILRTERLFRGNRDVLRACAYLQLANDIVGAALVKELEAAKVEAHAALRRRHFAEIDPRMWWSWRTDGDRQTQFVTSHLRQHGYSDPVRRVEWPNGWFVELADGRVLFVEVEFDSCCARYGRPIVEVRTGKEASSV